jgi:hypothetical protein
MTCTTKRDVQHVPNRGKLPKALQGLPSWQPMTPAVLSGLWADGDCYLMAVPVCDRHDDESWTYELWVVTIRCDEGSFAVEHYGEPWCWELEDADYYIRL